MPNYIPYDPSQSKRVIINYTDQLHLGTFEQAIHFLIEHKLDLSVFDLLIIMIVLVDLRMIQQYYLPTRKELFRVERFNGVVTAILFSKHCRAIL